MMLKGEDKMHNKGSGFINVQKGSRVVNLIFVTALFIIPLSAFTQNRVVGYYPGWMKTKLPASKVLFQHITHINHAFAWPNADGSISSYTEINHPELITAAHQAGRKILISLGGWGQSDGFAPMAADTAKRKIFVQNLLSFCQTRGYDGADFDWEFPASTADRATLTALVKETREAFNLANPSLLVTMVAVAGDWNGKWHDYPKLAEYVDWFNLMAYDFHGTWTTHAGHNAPLYAPATDFDGSAHQGVQYLYGTRGIQKTKLNLGVPFYGKEFNATRLYGPSTGGTELEYNLIAPRMSAGWTRYWDNVSKVPYLMNPTNNKFVTFDDSLSLSTKVGYVKQNGLGGMMIWALGQDVLNNAQPLLEALGLAMATSTAIEENQSPLARNFELFNNYPNPFNASTTIAFHLEREAAVKLSIYNLIGESVTVLINSKMAPGRHAVTWDASDQSSAVYFYRLETGELKETKRMILAK
jgi:chitinase